MMKTLKDPMRKKLLYRAQHRGIKEADLVVGSFAEVHLATMSAAQVLVFEALLEVPDHDLYAWIIGRAPVPPEWQGEVMSMMQAFSVVDAVQGKTG